MTKKRIVMLVALLFVATYLLARTFGPVTFTVTESILSQGGQWISGGAAGNCNGAQKCWADVRTFNGMAIGTTRPNMFGDSTALVAGNFGPNQTVESTLKVTSTPSGCCREAEQRLRSTISTQWNNGYEVTISVHSGGSYLQFVKWYGPNGSFDYLAESENLGSLANAQKMKSSITGGATNTTITVWLDRGSGYVVVPMKRWDNGQTCPSGACLDFRPATQGGGGGASAILTGNPGIGFYDNNDDSYSNYGWSSFTATDGIAGEPVITAQPSNTSVAVGNTANFSFTATGATSYSWSKNGSTIGGATSNNYTTPATTAQDNGAVFQGTATNASGSVLTNQATLTVTGISLPVITAQPQNTTVAQGATANFSVTATGATSYQWFKNGTSIGGATSSSYTTPATVIQDDGSLFRVDVTNSNGTVSSNNATPSPMFSNVTRSSA